MTDTARKTRKFRKSFCGASSRALCCVLCCILTLMGTAVVSAEESIDDLNSQKAALAEQQAALEAQRSDSAESLEEQKEQRDILQQQINVKSQEIAINQQLTADLDTQIAEKNAAIAAQETQILALDSRIESQFGELRLRLRALSKESAFSSSLRMLMDSESYVDYLMTSKLAERISQNDQLLMEELENNIRTAQTTKAQLESDKAQLVSQSDEAKELREQTESDKQALQMLYIESEAMVEKLNEDVAYYDESIAEIEAKQAAMQSKIDDIMARIAAEEEERRQQEAEQAGSEDESDDDGGNSGGGSFQSGTMYWPAPTCTVITSSYKYREIYGRWHYGVDIACYGDAEGEPIVAAADGTVVYANRYDTWGDGYGLYLMIDHGYDDWGQRIITLYAHCSAVTAYEGMTVSAGDLIAYVGNTGGSDGAHLHFEVRVDGYAVDPVSNGYLSTDGIDVLA